MACTGTILSEEEQDKLVLAHESRWSIPPDVLAVGDLQDVGYTGAGAWTGNSSCFGGMTPGAGELKDFLAASFPQVSMIGGYNCRSIVGNSSRMSVHGTGRALDLHIPTIAGHADNQAGDAIGNWLIENSEDIGIQYIIWDRTQWTAEANPGTKARRYNGSHAHRDHLHIELSVAGGQASTPWFSGPREEPSTPACESIAAAGSTIDNDSQCLHLHGTSQYWRAVDGTGMGGDLVWTNAFQGSSPSNWAQWELHLEEAGDYEVDVFLDPSAARFRATQYRLRHGGTSTELVIDQSQGDGWTTLGGFSFSAGGNQSVSLLDNSDIPPGQERSIAVDALRLRRMP